MEHYYANRCTVTLYEEPAFTRPYDGKLAVEAESPVLSTIADEILYGMPVDVLEEAGDFFKVRTFYSYVGYALKKDFLLRKEVCHQMVTDANMVDVLEWPKVQAQHLISLTRGCLIEATNFLVDGYRRVILLDGRVGYVPDKHLRDKWFDTSRFDAAGTAADRPAFEAWRDQVLRDHFDGSEEAFRDAVAAEALRYAGTNYRWGCKTPLGIDCSGLTSMSYMLNGILTYRDAKIVEGFPVRPIPREALKKGDLLFFAGHIAMYLGEGLYVHSTAHAGSNGVDINSLNPDDPRYREDLDKGLLTAGTIF